MNELMHKIRCPGCRGLKKCPGMGGMISDCNLCKGEGHVHDYMRLAHESKAAPDLNDTDSAIINAVSNSIAVNDNSESDIEDLASDQAVVINSKKAVYKRKSKR